MAVARQTGGGRSTRQSRSGFALIELPFTLAVLALVGLCTVAAIHYFARPVAWYAWLIGCLVLPGTLLLLGLCSVAFERAFRAGENDA